MAIRAAKYAAGRIARPTTPRKTCGAAFAIPLAKEKRLGRRTTAVRDKITMVEAFAADDILIANAEDVFKALSTNVNAMR